MRICYYHGSVIIRPLHDILDNHIILHHIIFHHITDENTVTDVGVDTTAFVGYRGPQTDPFASSLKIGIWYIFSACNIVIHWCMRHVLRYSVSGV